MVIAGVEPRGASASSRWSIHYTMASWEAEVLMNLLSKSPTIKWEIDYQWLFLIAITKTAVRSPASRPRACPIEWICDSFTNSQGHIVSEHLCAVLYCHAGYIPSIEVNLQ